MTYANSMALLMAFGIWHLAFGIWQDLTPSSTKCPGKSHLGIRFTSDGTNARTLRREQKARPDPSIARVWHGDAEQEARPDPVFPSSDPVFLVD